MTANPLRAALRRDRIAVLVGLIAVIAAGWVYLLRGAGIEMDKMDMGGGRLMVMMPEWTPGYGALVLLMWAVMMAAMMLPSAAPAIVQFANLAQRSAERTYRIPTTLFFVIGYLMVWTGFGFAATFLQWVLDSRNLLSDTMAIRKATIAEMLVIAVGLYQLTQLKQTCLRLCRSSARCLTQHQHQSAWAITQQGMRYGVSCLGCCSILMGLLFVGGVMNPLWMALISFWVVAEKTLPWGSRIARGTGVWLVAWGSISLAVAGL